MYLPYRAAEVFDLVADVERYPEFVPGWREARVRCLEAGHLTAEQVVTLGPLEWRFTSDAKLDRPRTMAIHSVDAPFGQLDIRWTFEGLGDAGCAIVFRADYDLGTGTLRRLVAASLERRLLAVVNAFEKRAHMLCGGKP